MRIDGHPWLHAPSGSTTHPSVQHAGEVASHIALRVKSSRVSGVNPSFSRASVAVMRYGLRAVVFIWFYRASIARRTHGVAPMDSPENSSFDEVSSTLSVWRNMDRLETASGTRAQETHGTWGTDRFTGAQAFTHGSFGTHPES